MKKFDIEAVKAGKKAQLNGNPLKYLHTLVRTDPNATSYYPHMFIEYGSGGEYVRYVSNDGVALVGITGDCVATMAPEYREYWVNIYRCPGSNSEVYAGASYLTQEQALAAGRPDKLATLLAYKEEI